MLQFDLLSSTPENTIRDSVSSTMTFHTLVMNKASRIEAVNPPDVNFRFAVYLAAQNDIEGETELSGVVFDNVDNPSRSEAMDEKEVYEYFAGTATFTFTTSDCVGMYNEFLLFVLYIRWYSLHQSTRLLSKFF